MQNKFCSGNNWGSDSEWLKNFSLESLGLPISDSLLAEGGYGSFAQALVCVVSDIHFCTADHIAATEQQLPEILVTQVAHSIVYQIHQPHPKGQEQKQCRKANLTSTCHYEIYQGSPLYQPPEPHTTRVTQHHSAKLTADKTQLAALTVLQQSPNIPCTSHRLGIPSLSFHLPNCSKLGNAEFGNCYLATKFPCCRLASPRAMGGTDLLVPALPWLTPGASATPGNSSSARGALLFSQSHYKG